MPTESLTPVVRTTLTADICRKMVSHLIRGIWSEGEKIPAERELCQKLGVGRASLREALKALEIMGMIETRLGDGTYVCKRSDFFPAHCCGPLPAVLKRTRANWSRPAR